MLLKLSMEGDFQTLLPEIAVEGDLRTFLPESSGEGNFQTLLGKDITISCFQNLTSKNYKDKKHPSKDMWCTDVVYRVPCTEYHDIHASEWIEQPEYPFDNENL